MKLGPRRWIDLDGVPVRTIDLVGLLKTKMTTREKDVSDRIIIQKSLDEMREK